VKIARAAARIKKGLQADLALGSLAGRRDWGWAPDYVRGMWQMLQADPVDDFVLATGHLHSVEEWVNLSFSALDLNWRDFVKFDPLLITKVEQTAPCGNPGKAKRLLGWENTVPFQEIVARLVRSETDRLGT
jgi:GDPmannose 4,6-dehydratase